LLCSGGLLMEYHSFEMHDGGHLQNGSDPVKGTAAILSIVGLSGFAGVMTQILLQDQSKKGVDAVTLSIWDRNLQFAFWSVMFGVCSLGMDTSWIARGLFAEWTPLTVLLVLVWTAGGLLVALTIKYTDVIVKGFASALSLILICFNGWLILGDYLDIIFVVGAVVTVIATFNYNDRDSKAMYSSLRSSTNDNRNSEALHVDISVTDSETELLTPSDILRDRHSHHV